MLNEKIWVLTAVTENTSTFWNVMSRNLIKINVSCERVAFILHLEVVGCNFLRNFGKFLRTTRRNIPK